MYVPFSCQKCKEMGLDSSQAKVLSLYRDDGIYDIQCKHGHNFVGVFQRHLYQILFEIGAYAILDGYYRESVASFASSLERFLEYYIQVIAISKNIDMEAYKKAWKLISAQSERQFGAFIFIYLYVNKKPPNLLTEKYRSFRNDVIHKGKIPTKEKAIEYGDCVKNTIEDLTLELCEIDQEAMNTVVRQFLAEAQSKIGGQYAQNVSTTTILGRSKGEIYNWKRPNLETHLERIEHVRRTWLEEKS